MGSLAQPSRRWSSSSAVVWGTIWGVVACSYCRADHGFVLLIVLAHFKSATHPLAVLLSARRQGPRTFD